MKKNDFTYVSLSIRKMSMSKSPFSNLTSYSKHSKRLYPLKVLPKDRVEWAFSNSLTPEQSDWILINKDEAGEPPAGFEKVIGFEGKPDPA